MTRSFCRLGVSRRASIFNEGRHSRSNYDCDFGFGVKYHASNRAVSSFLNFCSLDMSGRRLLDAITFLNASRNVAAKHIALQRRTLDLHARTSSLTKEAKAQADRIGLAVKAASDLARKLDEPSPPSSGPQHPAASPDHHAFEEASNTRETQGGGGYDAKTEPETARSRTVDDVDTKSSGVINGESAAVAPQNKDPIIPAMGDGAAVKQDEIPAEMMGQLFRSSKVSNSLFRDRMPDRRARVSEKNAAVAPSDIGSARLGNVDNSSTESKTGHFVVNNQSTPVPPASIDQNTSARPIDTIEQTTGSSLSQQVSSPP